MAQAVAAKALLNNTFLPTVLDRRRADIIQRWEGAGDGATREEAWQQLRALNELAGAIERECRDTIKRIGGDADAE